MNNYFKIFSAFLVTLFSSLTMFATGSTENSTIPAPPVSINNYPNGAVYIIKNNDKTVVTPIGCSNTDPITWTLRKFESDSPVDPFDIKPTRNWSEVSWSNPERHIIGADTIYTTIGNQGTPVDSKFQSVEYKLTCTSVLTSTVVTKSVTLVTALNNEFSPKSNNSQPIYRDCGNPATGRGYRISFEIGRTLDNVLIYKKPNDADYVNTLSPSGRGYGYFELSDGDVQNGVYGFRYQFHKYFNGTSEVEGDFSSPVSFAVTRKTGSPKANDNIIGGLLFKVNSNVNNAAATVCPSDKVQLYWNFWNDYMNNPEYANNYDFEWRKNVSGNSISLGTGNYFPIDLTKDVSGNYWLYFIPKNNSVGCPTDFIQNGTDLALSVKSFATPTILGDSKVCPDGSIELAVTKTDNMSSFAWTNASNEVVGSSEKLTVTSAGTYSIQFVDNSIKNSLNESCLSPKASLEVTSYNKPVAPTVNSSDGKNKYCDYDFKSATLKAVSTWSEAAISSWTWTTNATTAGTASSDSYITKGFGTYNVTYKDAFGCVSAKSADFVIAPIARPATPSIKLTGNAYNCEKNDAGVANTVTFDLSSAALAGSPSYVWYNGSTPISGATGSSLKNYAISGSISLNQTDASTGCTSLNSSAIAVKFETNPTFSSAAITKAAYTLTASGFDAANANDYVWKVGTTSLGTSVSQKITGTSAGEYTVAQYKAFTLNGTTIKCLSTAAKYSYVPDPEFSGIIAYPNPYNASSQFTIDVVDTAIWNGAAVSVYDMMGRLVYSSTLTLSSSSAGAKFDLKALGNGIYVLNLNANSGNTFQTKLVINK